MTSLIRYKWEEIIFSQNGVTKFASQWVIVKGIKLWTEYCTKPRDDFVQVNKTLSATRKNIPYCSLLNEGSFKKLNLGFTFDLSHSLVYGGQNQKPPERRWCPPKQTYNWIAAKRRINRHDLYGASAAVRLTAQRRAGLPVRKVRFGSVTNNIQSDVTLFKAHKPLCMRPLSDETPEG